MVLFMLRTRKFLTSHKYCSDIRPNTMLITRDPILLNSNFVPSSISKRGWASPPSPPFLCFSHPSGTFPFLQILFFSMRFAKK